MRKIAFIKTPNEDNIHKLLIYDSAEGVFLFGYDCLQDTSALWDNWFETIKTAEEYCSDNYQIDQSDWIEISEPCADCQHDFIQQTRVKGRNNGNPQWGKFETNVNGKWIETISSESYRSFGGLTGNERLFISGLLYEFDYAKKYDREKAQRILSALDFDKESISKILL